MTRVSLLALWGEPWVASGDSTFASPHLTEMQNQEDYWENWDFQQQQKKTALASPPGTTKQVFGLQYFSAPIHPVQLFHLLHTPTGSAADSQGLSHCHRWDLKDLIYGQVTLADLCENCEDHRAGRNNGKLRNRWKRFFNSVCLPWWNCGKICLSPPRLLCCGSTITRGFGFWKPAVAAILGNHDMMNWGPKPTLIFTYSSCDRN